MKIGGKTYSAGTAKALSMKCDTSSSYISQVLTRVPNPSGEIRTIGPILARKLEKYCKKPIGWMDVSHEDIDPAENELRILFAAMDEKAREKLLKQARLIKDKK